MRKVNVSDKEVIEVMKDGGLQLVEYAKKKWMSNEYGDDTKMKWDNLKRWNTIANRISELARLLKEAVKE